MARLAENSYGKSAVRLTKVVRSGPVHTLYEFAVEILLEGDFGRMYTRGDNSSCIATDTMKNTVFALAKKHEFDSPEGFGQILTRHFLEKFPHVSVATVSIQQILWKRIELAGKAHDHSFVKASDARRTATTRLGRAGSAVITGGIAGLEVVKTAQSGFVGYLSDPYTTLKPTTDRIFGTNVQAVWTFASADAPFNSAFDTACRKMLETFATHDSLGVQQTLFAMGEAVLAELPFITKISLTMPNQHRLLVNLEPFGMTNQNEIFVSSAEPFGLINGTVTRE